MMICRTIKNRSKLLNQKIIFFKSNGQNLFRTVEKSLISPTVWSQRSSKSYEKMPHFDHFSRPWEIDPYASPSCLPLFADCYNNFDPERPVQIFHRFFVFITFKLASSLPFYANCFTTLSGCPLCLTFVN